MLTIRITAIKTSLHGSAEIVGSDTMDRVVTVPLSAADYTEFQKSGIALDEWASFDRITRRFERATLSSETAPNDNDDKKE